MNYLQHLMTCMLIVWAFSTGKAQSVDLQAQLAYHYGIVTGYTWQHEQLFVTPELLKDMTRGIEAYTKESSADALTTAEQLVRRNKEAKEERAYAYGVLIADNWQQYEVACNTVNLEALKKGIQVVFEQNNVHISQEEAQKQLIQDFKALQEDKSAIKKEANRVFFEKNSRKPTVITLDNGIQYEVLKEGEGQTVGQTNKRLSIQYTGQLLDGTVFEKTEERPIIVTINSVLLGWKSLLPLLRKNQTIRAYIPPHLGYGEQPRGDIPAHSILIYEMTLLDVLKE